MRRNKVQRRSVRVLLGAGLVAAALGWSASPALAHNDAVEYSPVEGAVVTEQPGMFRVTTNDELVDLGEGSGRAMAISGPADATTPLYYGDGCVTLAGPSIETTAQLGQPGEYTVTWQAVSADGHPVSEEYSFTWQPAEGQALAAGSAAVPTCGQAAGSTDATAAPAEPGGTVPDAAWISAAAAAVVLAGAVALFAIRRRTRRTP
ncbi:copper resistance protein CopC [Cryobacterium sp. TMT4-10]|uniref:copper resistance CopC family protein n=1 Tax=Cryobacterium sp. TMT4-10 TaxID=1259256 RepID=UPI0010691083|nr:copper resistance protein CopC [Cryobacterium sp. TMT4-10]TFD14072.1 copper resistance protein CopC [Cryobacterium sp. TMT4-10]